MKIIETIFEVFGWLIIALGTTAGFGLIAVLVYIKWDNGTGHVVAWSIGSIGFILGSIWATRIWIKHGTIAWLSSIRRNS